MTLALTPPAIALVLTTATSAASATRRTAKRLIKKTPMHWACHPENKQASRDSICIGSRCAMGRTAHLASCRGPDRGRPLVDVQVDPEEDQRPQNRRQERGDDRLA